MNQHPNCDLFCRVIDNYGDIGVCWRLARQLSAEHGWHIRLWVDDTDACEQLTHGAKPKGIELHAWTADFPILTPASIVIEAFACELPESYLAAMAAMPTKPVWLNLEYLCVEDWGPGFHLQPSPHPRLPLLKHFFVPGILPGTGGVLREKDLLAQKRAFDDETVRRSYAADTSGRWIFLFCYDNPALTHLLDIWANGEQTTHCLVSAGKANAQVANWLGQALLPGQTLRRGNLVLHVLPFVAQHEFDALLWTCDLNFVRGEDSFCRALWSDLPFVWHIYPQEAQDNAHHAKLDAFYRHYAALGQAGAALTDFSRLWNGITEPTPRSLALAWEALEAELPALNLHAQAWRTQLENLGDLAGNLAAFCQQNN